MTSVLHQYQTKMLTIMLFLTRYVLDFECLIKVIYVKENLGERVPDNMF